MAEAKTKVNDASVEDFLQSVDNDQRREDAFKVDAIMQEVMGEKGKMWGKSIVGYGTYTYTYASGRTGDWMLSGFSPRKNATTIYIMAGFEEYDGLMEKLGKFKTGKSCLYVKKMDDIDTDVLKELIKKSADHVAATNAPSA